MSKRLAFLEQAVNNGTADAFVRYALALEYKSLKRYDEALEAFAVLRETFPDYLAQYLMAGSLLLELDRPAEARGWLEAGIELARTQGNGKALGELEEALENC